MKRAIQVAFGALLVSVGCASHKSEQNDRFQSFPDAVQECRPKRSGRTSQNTQPSPTSGPVAECLKHHGWNPDGTRR